MYDMAGGECERNHWWHMAVVKLLGACIIVQQSLAALLSPQPSTAIAGETTSSGSVATFWLCVTGALCNFALLVVLSFNAQNSWQSRAKAYQSQASAFLTLAMELGWIIDLPPDERPAKIPYFLNFMSKLSKLHANAEPLPLAFRRAMGNTAHTVSIASSWRTQGNTPLAANAAQAPAQAPAQATTLSLDNQPPSVPSAAPVSAIPHHRAWLYRGVSNLLPLRGSTMDASSNAVGAGSHSSAVNEPMQSMAAAALQAFYRTDIESGLDIENYGPFEKRIDETMEEKLRSHGAAP